jgi:hypothetical protein
MSKIDKKLVYNAYDNENIWLTDTEENFMLLYEKGYRYITHYQKQYDTVYSIDSSGGYDLLSGVKYSTLEENKKTIYKDLTTIDDFIEVINNPKATVIWHHKEKYEITKGDPVYSVLYSSVPYTTSLYNFYAMIEV